MSEEWKDRLNYTSRGQLRSTSGNAALILGNDEQVGGVLRYNEFAMRIEWAFSPPEIVGMRSPNGELEDEDLVWCQQYLNLKYRVKFGSTATIYEAVKHAAKMRTYNPVEQYLRSLKWDGVKRVSNWLANYLGVANSKVNRLNGRFWLISAVARAFSPGEQVDHIMVLIGPQGHGKSSTVRVLAGKWYQSNIGSLNSKDAMTALNGAWIVNIDELASIQPAKLEKVKSYITRRIDKYRPPYAKTNVTHPRRCVFCGTCNDEMILKDPTGGRRFWPVLVGKIDLTRLKNDKDQIWAEAVRLYEDNNKWWPEASEIELFKELQDAFYAPDPWEARIFRILDKREKSITMAEILEKLELPVRAENRSHTTRVGKIMKKLGWEKKRQGSGAARIFLYWPPSCGNPNRKEVMEWLD